MLHDLSSPMTGVTLTVILREEDPSISATDPLKSAISLVPLAKCVDAAR